MEQDLTMEQIERFSQHYDLDKQNKKIEKQITKKGLEKACLKKEIIKENEPIFTIELPDSKRQDQKDSYKCWIYAGTNMIKYNIANNLKMDLMEIQLSNSYIAFFDKLEKSNHIYETIITTQTIDFETLNKEDIITYCVSESGYWQWFASIVTKYGIVPNEIMPDAVEAKKYKTLEQVYVEKVKKDLYELLELKKILPIEQLRKKKEEFLQENYKLLSNVLGKPNMKFDYHYIDRQKMTRSLEQITPKAFAKKFLTLDLGDFVSIGNIPAYNREYGKRYQKKYLGNIIGKSSIEYLNLPMDVLKQLVVQQLEDGIPVWFATNITKFRNTKLGILDTRLYQYEQIGWKKLSKKEACNLGEMGYQHAMTFIGVYQTEEGIKRWKVEDSYGNKDKIDGCYIMNDNFFENYVLNIIIHKKYLSKEQQQMLEQEPILYDVQELI